MSETIRVLYVDDDVHSAELRTELLSRHGDFDIVTESNVRDGLARLAEEPDRFDCVLSDLEMSETDGLGFLEAVRDQYPDLPFIMFSAKDSEAAVEAALDAGATDYIPKSTAALSYRLVAQRIESAVASAADDADTRTAGSAAAAIREAVGEEAPEATPTSSARDQRPADPCPVPGCEFEATSVEELARHCSSRGSGDDIDARLHRRLNPVIDGARAAGDGLSPPPRDHAGERSATSEVSRAELASLSDEALYTMARLLAIPGRGRMRRRALIDAIASTAREPATVATTGTNDVTGEDIETLRDILSRLLAEGRAPVDRPSAPSPPAGVAAPEPTREREGSSRARTDRGRDLHEEANTFSFSLDEPTREEPSSEPAPESVDGLPPVDHAPGEAALVCAPTHDDTRERVCDARLAADRLEGKRILLVQYRRIDPGRLERIALTADELTLVSVGHDQGVPERVAEHVNLITLDKPGDFRRLGIVITRVIEEWAGDPGDIFVCFDSLNVLMRYGEIQTIFRFLHLLLGKLEQAHAISHFHLDPTSEEERDVSVLGTLFDEVVDCTAVATEPTSAQ